MLRLADQFNGVLTQGHQNIFRVTIWVRRNISHITCFSTFLTKVSEYKGPLRVRSALHGDIVHGIATDATRGYRCGTGYCTERY